MPPFPRAAQGQDGWVGHGWVTYPRLLIVVQGSEGLAAEGSLGVSELESNPGSPASNPPDGRWGGLRTLQ